MTLAIHASTPPMVSTGAVSVTNQTTASFTPPVGALIVVPYYNNNNNDAMAAPTNTGGAVTWDGAAAVTNSLAGSMEVQQWLGTVTTSASMTVNVAISGGLGGVQWGMGAIIVTGQAAVPKGQTQTAAANTGTPTGTIAALTGANSLVIGAIACTTGGAPTPGAGQSDVFNGNTYVGTNNKGWAQYLTGMSLAAGASATINDTAPTAVNYVMGILEILAAPSSVPFGYPHLPFMAPQGGIL